MRVRGQSRGIKVQVGSRLGMRIKVRFQDRVGDRGKESVLGVRDQG